MSNESSAALITSPVAGIVGLLLCWIPFIGILGWVLGPIAVVCGVVGVRQREAGHRRMSWFGLVLGVLVLAACAIYAIADVDLVGEST